jgi:hypothetical protein
MLNLEVLHDAVFRDDPFEQVPEGGDVPLPFAEFIDQPA